jgi:hypothetical protein
MFYFEQLLPSLTIGNVEFESILSSDFIGFYDWLRSTENQICGVRLTPFDFAEHAISKIKSISYLKLQPDSTLEVYFTNVTNYTEEISCDQDFGRAKIYMSENLVYAIGFNIENLTLKEKEQLDSLVGL